MSQPLLATWRIQMDYTVNGFLHRNHMYCKATVAGASYNLDDRTGAAPIDWVTAAQNVWTLARALFTAATVASPAAVVLQQRSGTLWNPIQFATLTGIGSHAGTYSPASQLTIVLRDTGFKKLRVVWLELAEGYTGHANSGGAFATAVDPLTKGYNGVSLNPLHPWAWMKSRGDRFIAATGADAGVTLDLNDKLKRARNLE